jgi:hypothetical protein
LQVLEKSDAVLERPENVSVAFGEDAIFSCKTHKALREFTSWVRLTGSDIIELEEGTEVLRIHNVTESDLVSLFYNKNYYRLLPLGLHKFGRPALHSKCDIHRYLR